MTFPLQILSHLVGDYFFQTNYQAVNKNKNSWAAVKHCLTYTLCFYLVMVGTNSINFKSLFWVFATHFLIDRFGLAKYWFQFREVGIVKDLIPFTEEYKKEIRENHCPITGLTKDRIEAVKWFVYIVADNTLHLICNYIILN